MSSEVNFSGQKVIINEFNNVVRINIDSAFQDPSYRMHSWSWASSGFGINEKIIEYLLEKKMRLFVHENETNNNFIIDSEKVAELIKNHDLKYIVKKTNLIILPKNQFDEL